MIKHQIKHMNSQLKKPSNIEQLKKKVSFGVKIWLEFNNEFPKNILGSGWANLLEKIYHKVGEHRKSLTQAAKECGYSYKYAWNILKRIETRTGFSPVETTKGGAGGGGSVELNEWGIYLLTTYKILVKELESIEKRLEKTLKID
jgi:molybdate transport repressor ModE-like protein